MKSIQINIRVSEDLVDELDDVCKVLKIARADWIRTTLAREVFDEHTRLMGEMKEVERLMDSDLGRIFSEMRARSHARRRK